MFNLLVTAEEGVWDKDNYILDKSRFLEYTDEDITKLFRPLNHENIKALCEIPTLFAYEGKDELISLGYITDVKERANKKTLLIEFEIIQKDFLVFKKLEPYFEILDIRK